MTKTMPAPANAGPPEKPRMTLDALRRGRRVAPDRILVLGVEGVGKSTLAASAPSPIFLAAEDGVRHLDVVSFPEPRTWRDVREAIRTLTAESHDFRTLVIDTIDWVEPLLWAHVCRSNGWRSMEELDYGKCFVPANDEWRAFLNSLDALRAERSMEILVLAHTTIKEFRNPAGPDYSRFEGKLQKGAYALFREWADMVLFATYEESVLKKAGVTQDDPTKRGKAVSTGRRVLYTERTPAWDAKNRHNLPPVLPLSYEDLDAARKAGQPASPAALEAEARELLAKWAPDDATKAKAEEAIAKAAGNAANLAKLVDRLRSKVAEKGGE